MKLKSIHFLSAFCLLSALVILTSCQSEENKTTLVKVGQQVPLFTFTDNSGTEKPVTELKGQVVMITFFATWCGPCLKELPHIQQDIFEKYQNNANFTLLVIGREHTPEELTKFKEDKDFSLEFIADPERKIYSNFATQFIPRNFLVNQDGKIIYSSIGFDDEEFNKLEAILADQLTN
ncbi:TlpA family protein disulfide reductase [Sunxiuqinia sp. sy24]|uniref:TlpA family protein disulfide reductase n=1 Tax=Sunxiuqinia sp. sy24 TaxID=3461495 RepID=UPI004045CAC4